MIARRSCVAGAVSLGLGPGATPRRQRFPSCGRPPGIKRRSACRSRSAVVTTLRSRRPQRLALFDNMHGEDSHRVIGRGARIVHDAGRNLEPLAGLVEMVRLAVDLDDEFLFENEGGLESGMSVAAGAGALGDIGISLHGLVAGRKIR